MKTRIVVVSVAIAVLACAVAVAGQQATATLRGVVTDSHGNVLPGATVTVKVGGGEFQVVTGVDGGYSLAGLPAGRAEVTGTISGFQNAARHSYLTAGRTATLDLTLCFGALAEIDWVIRGGTLTQLLALAGTVAHVRVTDNAGRMGVSFDKGRATRCESFAAARIRSEVLAVIKSPAPIAAGDGLIFWQEQWSGEPKPYAVGAELVVFLETERDRLIRSDGPSGVFAVENGLVRVPRPPQHGRYDGMRVDDFLRELRAVK